MRDFLLVRVMWQATSSSRLNWSCTKQWPWLKTTSSCNSFKCLPSIFSPVDEDQVVRAVQVAGAGGRGVLLLAQTLWAACDTLVNLFSCHQRLTCSPYLAPFQSPGKCRRGTLVRRRFYPDSTLAKLRQECERTHARAVANKHWQPRAALDCCHFQTQ